MARNRFFEDEEIIEAQGSTLWRILAYLKPYKAQVALALLLIAITAVAAQVGPFLVKISIDQYMPEKDFGGVLRVSLIYVGLLMISAIAVRYRILLMVRTGNKAIEQLREDAFSHANRLSFKYFDERPAGKIIVRLMNNVDRLQQLVKKGVINIIADIFRLVVIFGFMIAISPSLTLVAAAVTPVLATFVFLVKSEISQRWELYHKKNSNINAYAHESFIGVKVTQSFVREEHNSEIMAEQLDESYKSWMRATRASSLMFPAVLLFNTLAISAVYLVGYRYLGFETVTLGTLIAFGSYVWMITEPIVNLSTFYNEILVALAAGVRVFDLMDTEPTIVDHAGAYELPTLRGEVDFRNVHFAYDKGTPILTGMSLSVKAGENIALVGETGAGKSTIINLISRFYDIQSGEIRLDGHEIRDVTLESLRRQVGVMMQDPFTFSGSVADNIRYGSLNASPAEIEIAAKAVRAHEFISQLPDGYDSEVGEGGNRLSAGQRQLLAFARTLLFNPSILILDEATASVDTQTEQHLQVGIQALVANRTSFVVAHRLSTIRNADRIMVVNKGTIIETGNHDELLAAGGKYAELHKRQYAQIA